MTTEYIVPSLVDYEISIFSCDYLFAENVNPDRERPSHFGEAVDLKKHPKCVVINVPESDYPIEIDHERIDGHKVCIFFDYGNGDNMDGPRLIGIKNILPRCFVSLEDDVREEAEWNAMSKYARMVAKAKRTFMSPFYKFTKCELEKYVLDPYIELAEAYR